jgi:pilus assembly protein CpaF
MRLADLLGDHAHEAPAASLEQLVDAETDLLVALVTRLDGLASAPRGLQACRRLVEDAAQLTPRLGALGRREQELVLGHVVDQLLTFGPLLAPMVAGDVTEITVNAPDTVWVERAGKKREHHPVFVDEDHLRQTVDRLLLLNPGKRLDEANAMIDVALPGGSRVHITVPPASPGGATLTIRRYQSTFRNLDALRESGALDLRMERFLIACVVARRNLLVSGGAGTGKTTLLDAIAAWIPRKERVITIEESLELQLSLPDVVRLQSRPANVEGTGGITASELFETALRMRPDRILLGELRGTEAIEFLQVVNAGVDGSMAVIHASTPRQAALRIEYLAAASGLGIPEAVIRRQLAEGVHIVVHLGQLPDGSRKIKSIAEVAGVDAEAGLRTRELFGWRGGRASGHFVATGYVPRVQEAFELAGLDITDALYAPGDAR